MDSPSQEIRDDIPPPSASGAASAGAVLARAREAKGLSIDDVSRQLKLSPAQLRALEADDHSSLPSPVFVRGFLRSYARMVGADISSLLPASTAPSAVVQQPSNTLQQQSSSAMDTGTKRPVFWSLVALACVIAGLSYYEFVVNAPLKAPAASSTPAPLPVQPVPVESGVPSTTGAPAATSAAVDVKLTPSLSVTPTTAGTTERALHFLFKKDSWVEISDADDNILMKKRNLAGSEAKLTGKPPFSLVVGAASTVELNYNGKPVDLREHVRASDVARLTLE